MDANAPIDYYPVNPTPITMGDATGMDLAGMYAAIDAGRLADEEHHRYCTRCDGPGPRPTGDHCAECGCPAPRPGR